MRATVDLESQEGEHLPFGARPINQLGHLRGGAAPPPESDPQGLTQTAVSRTSTYKGRMTNLTLRKGVTDSLPKGEHSRWPAMTTRYRPMLPGGVRHADKPTLEKEFKRGRSRRPYVKRHERRKLRYADGLANNQISA